MKEQDILKEFDEVIDNINRLTGEDARAFFKFIHGYLSIVGGGMGRLLRVILLKRLQGFIRRMWLRLLSLEKNKLKNHLNPFIKVIEILLSWSRKCTFL